MPKKTSVVGERIAVDPWANGRDRLPADAVGRDGEERGLAELFVKRLVVGEEERVIADDRPSDREAELVPLEGRLFGVEVVLGVEMIVPVELEERAVRRVGPGLGRGIDDAAGMVAEFRAEAVGQHLEFANGLDAEHVAGRAAGLAVFVVEVRAVEA